MPLTIYAEGTQFCVGGDIGTIVADVSFANPIRRTGPVFAMALFVTNRRVSAQDSPGAAVQPFEAAGVLLPHDPDLSPCALGQGKTCLCLFHRGEFCHDVIGHGGDFGGFARLVDVEGQCLTRGGEPTVFVP